MILSLLALAKLQIFLDLLPFPPHYLGVGNFSKKEREQMLEHQKKVREESEMKYRIEQVERERKEMQEKYRRRFGEQETKDFKCPKCGYCTQIPYKKVKYRCHMCGRVWSV